MPLNCWRAREILLRTVFTGIP
ncbi:MAG: hypothetical protein RJA51_710, partial [Actinomycetota bacterium]